MLPRILLVGGDLDDRRHGASWNRIVIGLSHAQLGEELLVPLQTLG